jgi:hypothetical protein
MDVLCQEAFTISLAYHTTCNKGLLLHSGLCSQGTCHIMQIPHLIPLVGSEGYRLHNAVSAGGHSAVRSQGCRYTSGQISVVSVKADSLI